jgi:hypothetical protein
MRHYWIILQILSIVGDTTFTIVRVIVQMCGVRCIKMQSRSLGLKYIINRDNLEVTVQLYWNFDVLKSISDSSKAILVLWFFYSGPEQQFSCLMLPLRRFSFPLIMRWWYFGRLSYSCSESLCFFQCLARWNAQIRVLEKLNQCQVTELPRIAVYSLWIVKWTRNYVLFHKTVVIPAHQSFKN